MRAGKLEARPTMGNQAPTADRRRSWRRSTCFFPAPLRLSRAYASRAGLPGILEDFAPGQVFLHDAGKTIGESEHMQLTLLFRNSHPLHFDEVYSKNSDGFQKTQVVYGGLVLGWTLSLTSRNLASNALWDLGLVDGAHPNPTLGGDTLYSGNARRIRWERRRRGQQ